MGQVLSILRARLWAPLLGLALIGAVWVGSVLVGAQTPVDGERLELTSADWEDVRSAGVILEMPGQAAAGPVEVPGTAAELSVRTQFLRAGEDISVAPRVLETKLAKLRYGGNPAKARLVWVVSIDANPPAQGPAGPYVVEDGGFWLHFVDAETGEVLGSVGANRISDAALEAEKDGTLPPWSVDSSEKLVP